MGNTVPECQIFVLFMFPFVAMRMLAQFKTRQCLSCLYQIKHRQTNHNTFSNTCEYHFLPFPPFESCDLVKNCLFYQLYYVSGLLYQIKGVQIDNNTFSNTCEYHFSPFPPFRSRDFVKNCLFYQLFSVLGPSHRVKY